MSYYQQLLTSISVSESAVDCAKCTAEWKCCTYRPFIANFLVGNFVDQLDEELFKEWDFLITGLSPGWKYRQNFFKKGKWGFGTDASLLCSFYNKKSGGCQIWSSRPAVCRTFFCKSSYYESGAMYWKKAEEFSWHLEWTLLEDFLFTQGWTIEDISLIKKYLDEKSLAQSQNIPSDYKLANLEQAKNFYKKAYEHVNNLAPEYVHEILGSFGAQIYQELLADKAKLR